MGLDSKSHCKVSDDAYDELSLAISEKMLDLLKECKITMLGNNHKVLTNALYDVVEANGDTNALSLVRSDANSKLVGYQDFSDCNDEIICCAPPQIPKENYAGSDIIPHLLPQIPKENIADSDIKPVFPPQILEENHVGSYINPHFPSQIPNENYVDIDIKPHFLPQIIRENDAGRYINPLFPPQITNENYVVSDFNPLFPPQFPDQKYVLSDIKPLFPPQIPNEKYVDNDIKPVFPSQSPNEKYVDNDIKPVFPPQSPNEKYVGSDIKPLFPPQITRENDAGRYINPLFSNLDFSRYNPEKCDSVLPYARSVYDKENIFSCSPSLEGTLITVSSELENIPPDIFSMSEGDTEINNVNCPPNLIAENEIDGNIELSPASETGCNDQDGYFYVHNDEIHYTSLPFVAVHDGKSLIGIRANHPKNSLDDLESYVTDSQIETAPPFITAEYIEEEKPSGENSYLNYLSKGLRDIKKSGKNPLSESPYGRKRRRQNNIANLAESSQLEMFHSLSKQAIALFPNSASEILNLDYFITVLHVICGSNDYEKLSVVKDLKRNSNLDNAVSFLLNLVYYVAKLLPDYDSVILTLIEAIEALIANPSVDVSSKDAIKYAVKGLLLIIAHQNSVLEWNNHWIRYRACRTMTMLLSASHIRMNSLQYTLQFLRKTISSTMTMKKCYGIVSLCTALGPDALDKYIWPSIKSFLEMIADEKTNGSSSGVENVNNIEIALTLAAVVMYKNFWSSDTLVTERHIIADSLLLDTLSERVGMFRSLAAIGHCPELQKKMHWKSNNTKVRSKTRNIFNPEVRELNYSWVQNQGFFFPNYNKLSTKMRRWFEIPRRRNLATHSIFWFEGLHYNFFWTIPSIRKAIRNSKRKNYSFTYANGIHGERFSRHIPHSKLHTLSCAGDLRVMM